MSTPLALLRCGHAVALLISGEYVRNARTIRIDLNGQLAAAKVALQLPSLNGLDLPTN
jgi:hypothetical protein